MGIFRRSPDLLFDEKRFPHHQCFPLEQKRRHWALWKLRLPPRPSPPLLEEKSRSHPAGSRLQHNKSERKTQMVPGIRSPPVLENCGLLSAVVVTASFYAGESDTRSPSTSLPPIPPEPPTDDHRRVTSPDTNVPANTSQRIRPNENVPSELVWTSPFQIVRPPPPP